VAIIFSLACAVPTASRITTSQQAWQLTASVAVFAAMVWLNCFAIGQWEKSDSKPHSVGRIAAFFTVALTALNLLAILLPTTQSLYQSASRKTLILAFISLILFVALDKNRNRLSPLTLRIAADAALLTPLLLLLHK
jgi:hypothetical protein